MDHQRYSFSNLKTVVWAFCCGLADSLKFSDIFFLDSQAERQTLDRLADRDTKKGQLLKNYDSSSSSSLAKRRAAEKRANPVSSNSNNSFGESRILERTMKCCVLNGCFFWFSIIIFENVLLPLLQAIILLVLGQSAGNSVWTTVVPFLSATFATLWVLPFYLLSKVVNAIWFADIADSAFRKSSASGRPRMMNSFSVSIADTVFSVFVEVLFLVQGRIFALLIPIKFVGETINLFHMCLLHALYCFEYKWYNQGLELHKRLAYVEGHWPYFMGFGLPLAIITSIPESQVVAGCVFSILFPLFIISGNQAHVAAANNNPPIRIFNPTITLSNVIFAKTLQS